MIPAARAARVERQIEYSKAEWIAAMGRLRPESIRPPVYPEAALREGGQATVGVMFEFGPDGKARDAFAVNVANDRWGMTKAALAAVQRYELKEPPGRAIRGCTAGSACRPTAATNRPCTSPIAAPRATLGRPVAANAPK